MYNDQNLSNYNNNVLLSTIIPKGEKTITIHLERKDAIGKNLINSSNVSTSDTNVNDKQYKSMRNKFMKINASYNKNRKKISNFNSLLENSINKIIKTIREFEEQKQPETKEFEDWLYCYFYNPYTKFFHIVISKDHTKPNKYNVFKNSIWNENTKTGIKNFTKEYIDKLILLNGKPIFSIILDENKLPILEIIYDWK